MPLVASLLLMASECLSVACVNFSLVSVCLCVHLWHVWTSVLCLCVCLRRNWKNTDEKLMYIDRNMCCGWTIEVTIFWRHLLLTFDHESYFSIFKRNISTRHPPPPCERHRLVTQKMLWERVHICHTGGVGSTSMHAADILRAKIDASTQVCVLYNTV